MNEPVSIAMRRAKMESGAELAYGLFGQKAAAEDPVFVLLHGYCGSSAYWEETLPHLEGSGMYIVPDLRGHGLSGTPTGTIYAMEDFAADVIRLLDVLGERQAVILGHSLGGYIALACAENYPERLRGFGLIHSTPLPDTDEARAGRDRTAGKLLAEGAASVVNDLVPRLFAAANRQRMADRVARAAAIGRGVSPAGAAAAALGMKARPDRSAVIRNAAVPVLLVAGSDDAVVPPERTFIDAAGPNVRRVLLEGCGHMSMMEAPAELAEAIAAFAADVTRD